MYEGAPNWPDEGRFWEIIEKYQGHDFLHGPDRDSRVHQVGRSLGRQARSFEPAAAGHGGRRDQSRGLDVVSPQDRRRALPDRRYLVADRNGRHHDEPAARRDRHQAGQLHQAVAGHHSGDRRPSTASRLPGNQGGWLVITKPWPACCAAFGATTIATRSSIGRRCRTSIWPATTPAYDEDGYYWIMGRIDDVLNVSGHRLSTIEIESALVSASRRCRGGGRRPAGRAQRGSRGRLRHAQSGRADDALRDELKKHVRKEIGALAQPDDVRFTGASAQDTQRQDHAAVAARYRRRQGNRRRHHDARRLQRAWRKSRG